MGNTVSCSEENNLQRFRVERDLVVTDLKGNHFDFNIGALEREVKSKLQRVLSAFSGF